MNQQPLMGFLQRTYVPSHGISEKAAKQMAVAVRAFERYLDRPPLLEDLTEIQVRDFLAAYGDGRAAATVNSKRRDLLSLWQAAAADDLITEPNRRRVPRRKQPKRIPEAWTLEELARLLRRLAELDYEIAGTGIPAAAYWTSIVLAVFASGCRISALRSTTSADCDLAADPAYIVVRAEFQKTGEDRIYPLTPEAARAIGLHFDPNRELVWPWPFSPEYFWKRFRGYVTEAGLMPTRRGLDLFHKLRRSHVTYLAATAGLEAARRSAGHTDARLTRASYIDPRILPNDPGISALPTIGR